jgi:hypothetical protein
MLSRAPRAERLTPFGVLSEIFLSDFPRAAQRNFPQVLPEQIAIC